MSVLQVHIRADDSSVDTDAPVQTTTGHHKFLHLSPVEEFTAYIKALHFRHPTARFLVVSNHARTAQLVANQVGTELVVSPQLRPGGLWAPLKLPAKHILHNFGQDVTDRSAEFGDVGPSMASMVEWELLAGADMIVGSYGSAFSQEAALVNRVPRIGVRKAEHGGSVVTGVGGNAECGSGEHVRGAECERFVAHHGLSYDPKAAHYVSCR